MLLFKGMVEDLKVLGFLNQPLIISLESLLSQMLSEFILIQILYLMSMQNASEIQVPPTPNPCE